MTPALAAPTRRLLGAAAAVVAPALATVALPPLGVGTSREYVFIYLGIVASGFAS